MAIVLEHDSHLVELQAGAMFYSADLRPDSQGLIKGMCKGQMVQIFARDLEERAEPLCRITERLHSAAPVIFSTAQPAQIDNDGD